MSETLQPISVKRNIRPVCASGEPWHQNNNLLALMVPSEQLQGKFITKTLHIVLHVSMGHI